MASSRDVERMWRARDSRDEVVLYSYFKVIYEYFDDVLRDRHCEHELGMSFLHGVCMTVEIMGENVEKSEAPKCACQGSIFTSTLTILNSISAVQISILDLRNVELASDFGLAQLWRILGEWKYRDDRVSQLQNDGMRMFDMRLTDRLAVRYCSD